MAGEGLLEDPLTVALIVVILGFVFAFYVFIRKIAVGFREGLQSGKRNEKR